MGQPLVSVIIPCYKQAHFLPECIASLQAQTMPDWEAIVVDDGSPDDTSVVAARLATDDARVRVHSKTNGGLSSARNAGLNLARGRFIQFLDADDLLLPTKFERHLEVAAKGPGLLISYTDYWFGESADPMQPARAHMDHELRHGRPVCDFAGRWEHDLSIPIHAPIFPHALLERNSIRFDASLPNHEDWDFWMRVVPLSDGLHLIPEALAIYRLSPGSMTSDRDRMWAGFRLAIRKQKALHAHDREVLRYLHGLSYRNDFQHQRGFAGLMRRALSERVRRHMPWPMQRLMMGRVAFLGIPDGRN